MQIQQNTSLLSYNTFGIEVNAQYFASFNSIEQLESLLDAKNVLEKQSTILPIVILGGGSNLLFLKDVEGFVLKNELKGIELIGENAEFNFVKAAAGEEWHQFVTYCIEHNYSGVENLSLIPGNVGASPMQNIGAYGVEIKDVFQELEAYHIEERKIYKFTNAECQFGYRESVFKQALKGQFIILNVTYKLRKQPIFNTNYGAINTELERMGVKELSIKDISQAVINIRSSKLPDPKVVGNAGSFFKNPQVSKFRWHVIQEEYPNVVAYKVDDMHYKLAAGWLIEQCGWKGFRRGDAGCHSQQALVLVNYGQARGAEILELAQEIILSVEEKFGVRLEREVNVV